MVAGLPPVAEPVATGKKGKKMKGVKTGGIFLILICTLMAMFGSKAYAFDVPPKPDNGWYIRDTAGKLSAYEKSTLNNKIESFNRNTKNEIGVLIISSLNGDSLDDAAHDVFNKWGIGKAGLDNGILLLIAANDHKIRIETGRGAEGDVTDLTAADIINAMKPYLKGNDYEGAVSTAIDRLSTVMENRTGQKPLVDSTTPKTEDEASPFVALVIVILFIAMTFIGVGWLFFSERRANRRIKSYYKANNPNYDPPRKFYSTPEPTRPDPYYPPPPPKPIVKTATTVGAVSEIEKKRERQKHEDAARKTRDKSRSETFVPDPPKTVTTYESTTTYESPSSSFDFGGSSGGGGFDGGGFGGGGSTGGGADGSW